MFYPKFKILIFDKVYHKSNQCVEKDKRSWSLQMSTLLKCIHTYEKPEISSDSGILHVHTDSHTCNSTDS